MRTLLLISALLLAAVSFANPDAVPSPSPTATTSLKKFDPRITAAYLGLLKKQADERKKFFEDQSHIKEEIEKRHVLEREDLVQAHRGSRKKFLVESHTREERALFFKSERSEMRSLEARQKSELLSQQAELEKKLSEFHLEQRKDREALESRLIKEHR